jgi:hypothetical protein
MATVDTRNFRTPTTQEEREERRTAEVVSGGSMVEAVCGLGGVVLAIVGLAGLLPMYLLAIASIAVGVAFLCEGGAIAARWSNLLRMEGGTTSEETELGSGVGVEVLGGIAGIVLGILALLQLVPLTLMAVAAIVFGATLLISSATTMQLNSLHIEGFSWPDRARRVAREALKAAAGMQVLAGLACGVLGIIALVGTYPLTLPLVAMLCAGAAVLLSGAAVSTRMLSLLRRW